MSEGALGGSGAPGVRRGKNPQNRVTVRRFACYFLSSSQLIFDAAQCTWLSESLRVNGHGVNCKINLPHALPHAEQPFRRLRSLLMDLIFIILH